VLFQPSHQLAGEAVELELVLLAVPEDPEAAVAGLVGLQAEPVQRVKAIMEVQLRQVVHQVEAVVVVLAV